MKILLCQGSAQKIEMYSGIKLPIKLTLILKKLNLTEQELQDLEAFLKSISSGIYREPTPEEFPKKKKRLQKAKRFRSIRALSLCT